MYSEKWVALELELLLQASYSYSDGHRTDFVTNDLLIFIVPAGDTCKPLKAIDFGGVIYSDLLLSPGVVANYVCQDGFTLYGYPNRTCASDGTWINDDKDPPVCRGEDSQKYCPIPFPNHFLYWQMPSLNANHY